MKRKKFIKSIGAGAAFALAYPCLHACSSDSNDEEAGGLPVPTGIDFTIDLDSDKGIKLAANGSFIIEKEVVVAKNLEGEFVAASQICSHQQTDGVGFLNSDGGIFRCSTHGARFSQSGKPLNSITANNLKIFKTALSGTSLRVFE